MTYIILTIPNPKQKVLCDHTYYEYQDNIGNDATIRKCSQKRMEDGLFYSIN